MADTPRTACSWCAKSRGHRPNCPRPDERYTAADVSRAIATDRAALRERAAGLRSLVGPLDPDHAEARVAALDAVLALLEDTPDVG